MKKILVTRKLLKDCEDKAQKAFETKLNSNDELYSQDKLIELSQGCDAVLTSLTDKMDENTINKLPETVKVISNFAKLDITLTVSGSLLIVFSSILSVKDVNTASHPWLSSINLSWEYNSSFEFSLVSNAF